MSSILLMTPKIKIAQAKTFFVGYLLISGAIKIDPTHWKAWLRPVNIPTR